MIKKILIVCMIAIPIISYAFVFFAKTSFEIIVEKNFSPNHTIFKAIPNTWYGCNGTVEGTNIKKKYVFISKCIMEPANFFPEQMTIEYAKWLTDEEIEELGLNFKESLIIKDGQVIGKNQKAIEYNQTTLVNKHEKNIDQLPPEAWHKITLYPQKIKEKYANVKPEGKVALLSPKDKTITCHIVIDASGKATVTYSQSYDYSYSDSGWRN